MQGNQLHRTLGDEACCIAECFVTEREQHLVALGATNCTYPPAHLAWCIHQITKHQHLACTFVVFPRLARN